MRVLIAGSSGLLGKGLTNRLAAEGHQVVRLVRRAANGADEQHWDPYSGRLDPKVVESADVVVNLGGSPTAGNPHSKKWAEAMMTSRVTTTLVLAEAIAESDSTPAYLAQNGIAYYGDHGGTVLTEDADSRGDALLTRVSRAWQEAAEPAIEAGSRVCILRTAPVLDKTAPPLQQLLPLFKLGLGARLGSGRQSFPVMSLRDWVGAAAFLATESDASGLFNFCCPDTPTNSEFTDALAAAVGRTARLGVPAAILRPAAGAMAPELLGSVNARPAALENAGYDFCDPDIEAILATALGRTAL